MKKIKFQDLSEREQNLILIAQKAQERAYAPYSKYKVGAAVLGVNGLIFRGCNVETATYSQTTHAERVAICSMVVAFGVREIKALACVAKDGGAPCAECRQVIWEFCGGDPNVKIIGANADLSEIQVFTIGELYPYAFGPKDLGIEPEKF